MSKETRRELDAVDLLLQDHRELESLFSEFDYLRQNGEDTAGVVESACAELKIHDALENDVFYPAVSHAAGDEGMEAFLDDAEDAHDSVLDLIEELELMHADVAKHNAHFSVIAEQVKEHILLEEANLFPRLKDFERLNLDTVAAAMKARKAELMADAAPAEPVALNV